MAAWVCAIIVKAAATAVLCTSTAFMVGGGGSAPHALRIKLVRTMTVRMEIRFMLCKSLLMILTIGETSTPGFDAVILHNNCPVALCDAETAECFKVLLAGDKCSGAISANGSRKAITGNDQIPALT